MADAYTSIVGFTEPAVSGDTGTWPGLINTDFQLIEQSICGNPGIPISGNYSLTQTNGATDDFRSAVYTFTGSLSGSATITIPGRVKVTWAANATTGGYAVTLTTGSGRTAKLPYFGYVPYVYSLTTCDGTNVDIPYLFQNGFWMPNQGWLGGYDASGTIQQILGTDAGGSTWIQAATSGTFAGFKNSGGSQCLAVTNSGANLIVGPSTSITPINSKLAGFSVNASTGTCQIYATDTQAIGMATKQTANSFFACYYNETLITSIYTTGTWTMYGSPCDYRIKEILGPASDYEKLLKLKIHAARWKDIHDEGKRHPIQPMVLAHELQELFPYCVTGKKDEIDEEGKIVPQQADLMHLVPTLIHTIQVLSKRIEALKAKRHG